MTCETIGAEGQKKFVSLGHRHYICQVHCNGSKKLLPDIAKIPQNGSKVISCSARARIGEDEISFLKRMENAQKLTYQNKMEVLDQAATERASGKESCMSCMRYSSLPMYIVSSQRLLLEGEDYSLGIES